ncbi:MAG: thioredoxin domain-containing protein [Patescibacteria group bacterium]
MGNQKDRLLPISILIAAVLIAGAVVYSSFKKTPQTNISQTEPDTEQISGKPQIGDDVVLGDPNAPVTMIVFGDYQCPFCAKFFKETESLIVKNYVETGKVKMIFKDLAFLGPESVAAAEAAECARDQQKYWQYHDALYEIEYSEVKKVIAGEMKTNEGNGNLNRNLFKEIASGLQMNSDEFSKCFDSEKYAAEVENDIKEAKASISRLSTPTIFIDDKMIQGAYPYNVFSQAIDEALNKK